MITQLRRALHELETPRTDAEVQIDVCDITLVYQPQDLAKVVESEDYI